MLMADTGQDDGIKIFFTHGHKWGVKYSTDRLFYKAKEIGAQIALFGHTHTAATTPMRRVSTF